MQPWGRRHERGALRPVVHVVSAILKNNKKNNHTKTDTHDNGNNSIIIIIIDNNDNDINQCNSEAAATSEAPCVP